VTLKASDDHVEPARRAVTQLLDDEQRRLRDPAEIRRTRGVQAYLEALADQPVRLPDYWTSQQSGTDVKDWANCTLACHVSRFHVKSSWAAAVYNNYYSILRRRYLVIVSVDHIITP